MLKDFPQLWQIRISAVLIALLAIYILGWHNGWFLGDILDYGGRTNFNTVKMISLFALFWVARKMWMKQVYY